ncbi:MAG: glycosyl hydrolase family 32 [Phycisphaerae bacterium]|nr:glycosyl hydrolase family 32 [Phycisphaerae bacterium]
MTASDATDRAVWRGLAAACVTLGLMAGSVAGAEGASDPAGETLYNGIRLPKPWPPKDRAVSYDPMTLPYLASPPDVIPIDVGRQLFVDDFLVEQRTLERTHYEAPYYPENPVVKPDRPWEIKPGRQDCPTAMVFSDGVWYDPADRLFKMWYMGRYVVTTCYATSKDGIHWDKPSLDVVKGTNIVDEGVRDSSTVWLDLFEKDAAKRYKMFYYPLKSQYDIFFSADGIHWGKPVGSTGPTGDRATVFYNPFRSLWVYSIRDYAPGKIGRCRRYWECKDPVAGSKWAKGEPGFWVGADRLDPRRPDLKDVKPELYNLDCVAYESLIIGLFSIWYGQPKDRAKPNELYIGYSRDGYHWDRPMRRPLIGVSERYGDWNWANIQSAGGCCLIVGDKLYFYVSGRAGVKGSASSGVCSTGLATMRRDGFASMDAGQKGGTLTTRKLSFKGKHLFVNADAHQGELRVEVLDADGKVVEPFTRDNCEPIKADRTLIPVKWKGAADLSAVAGKPVRLRFSLKMGRLYAFWVSPDASGASHGHVAAGGPGFTGATDTVGAAGTPSP